MTSKILDSLITSYPLLRECKPNILNAFNLIKNSFSLKGKLLLAGNGGSAADCDHIVGELMKGFLKKRKVLEENLPFIDSVPQEFHASLYKQQLGLPAINLMNNPSLISATINDVSPEIIFSQQILALANKNDIFLAISTSGNASNIKIALACAKAIGLKTILLTGSKPSDITKITDINICVPETQTHKIQELHLPVYHCLCTMLEEYFF